MGPLVNETFGSPTCPCHILLLDGEPPWVRALFAAMPPNVTIHAFRPIGLAVAGRRPLRLIHCGRWRQTAPRWFEHAVLIPSWSKTPRLTSAICAFHLGRRLDDLDGGAVVVFTLPHYSRLASRWPAVPKVYFAYDPYECYTGWNPAAIETGESEMLAHCDAAFAISPALADDFRQRTERPVFVQPNGVAESFLTAFDSPLPPPDDLPPGGLPVVGCVGQISRAYDWELLDGLVRQCPDLSFVFVGPLFGEDPVVQAQVDRVLTAPNVRWLGPKPHDQLPRYINRFDVCLNPLRVEPCNDRRSLLRLYDYLASDRPVASTAVACAREHRPHVEVGRGPDEMAALVRRLANGKRVVDRTVRREYVGRHTWTRRAELFLTNLRSVLSSQFQ
jgi:glycosyltransferase involved in cell wall biosynthesis